LDYELDRYVSVTVNGVTESLTGLIPEKSIANPSFRATNIARIQAQIIPSNNFLNNPANSTNDNIYWDNVRHSVTVVAAPEPGTFALVFAGGVATAGTLYRRKRTGK
jgi:hypothetical protein